MDGSIAALNTRSLVLGWVPRKSKQEQRRLLYDPEASFIAVHAKK